MRACLAILFFLLSMGTAEAEYSGGIVVDRSSNMLMVPGGESGAYTIAYGTYRIYPTDRLMASYNFAGGLLENYDGLQYHRHDLSAWYDLYLGKKTEWSVSMAANLSRYGNVTIIEGYNGGRAMTHIKSYLTQTLLLKWEGGVGLRQYRSFDSENYRDAETSLRLDKFFKTRTTLRVQFDAGYRSYTELEKTPSTLRLGVSGRIAQSTGDFNGVGLEFHASSIDNSGGVSDDTYMFNRVFLDDRYKYASNGAELQLRRLFPGKGTVTLKGNVAKRDYGEGAMESYSYLPESGWDETEWGASLILSWNFKFLPAYLHPSCELYYVDVKATESYLSYTASGLSIRFSFS